MPPADLESAGGVRQNGEEELRINMHTISRPSSKQQQTPNFSRPSISLPPQETGITNGDIISPIHEQSEYSKAQHEQHNVNDIPPDMPPLTRKPHRIMGVSWAEHRRQFWYGVLILTSLIIATIVIIKIVVITNRDKAWDGPVNIQPAVTLLPAIPSLTDRPWVALQTGL